MEEVWRESKYLRLMALRRSVALALVVASAGAAAGCGSSDPPAAKPAPTPARAAKPVRYAGAMANSIAPAPALRLKNSLGRQVDLRRFRGQAVLVTFVYVHCPDVCPLIVSNLRTTQIKLGAQASRLKVVAVSTDPSQDTPAAIKAFLRRHDMTGRMDYLVGSKAQLPPVWSAWGIKARRVDPKPKDVEHSALIYGISASGKLTTLYAAEEPPADMIHDVPLLAGS